MLLFLSWKNTLLHLVYTSLFSSLIPPLILPTPPLPVKVRLSQLFFFFSLLNDSKKSLFSAPVLPTNSAFSLSSGVHPVIRFPCPLFPFFCTLLSLFIIPPSVSTFILFVGISPTLAKIGPILAETESRHRREKKGVHATMQGLDQADSAPSLGFLGRAGGTGWSTAAVPRCTSSCDDGKLPLSLAARAPSSPARPLTSAQPDAERNWRQRPSSWTEKVAVYRNPRHLCEDVQGYTRILPQVLIFLSQVSNPQTSPPKVLLSSVSHHPLQLPQPWRLLSWRSFLFLPAFLHITHYPLPHSLGPLQNLPLLFAPAAPPFYFLSQFIFV